jgi:hypothetical protein
VIALGPDQLPAAQEIECGLDGALGEPGFFGQGPQTGGNRSPSRASSLAIEAEINEIRRRLAIVPDDVAHEDVDDVIVD